MNHRYLSSYYVALTGILTALLIVLAVFTIFIKFGNSSFQIADGLYLILVSIIPGPMMLIVGLIYPTIFDLLSGSFIFIPISIFLHCLMFILIKVFQGKISIYFLFLVSALLVFAYVPFSYAINLSLGIKTAQGIAIKELVIDSIQICLTFMIATSLKIIFAKTKFDRYLQRKIINSI